MKILVTGGAGYIGSVLVPELLGIGCEVTVLDNFMYGQAPLNQYCLNPDFQVMRGDARDERILKELLPKHDVLIPLAALVGAPLCESDHLAALSTNVGAIQSALELMSQNQGILIPITNSGYGIGEPGKVCDENSPLNPISFYGRTKVDAERMVLSRGNAISFRLATAFGMSPRMRLDLLVNDFVYRAVTDRAVVLFESHFKRNYIHVRDIASAFVYGIDHFGKLQGRPYNVGLSNANLSKLELCECIQQHIPGFTFLEAPIGEDVDKRDYVVSNARIEATGWLPKHSLDDGIKELIKGYQMIRNSKYGNA